MNSASWASRTTRSTRDMSGCCLGVSNVGEDGVVPQPGVLGNDGYAASHRAYGEVADVLAVDEDASLQGLVEALCEVEDGALAAARRADDADEITGVGLEAEVFDAESLSRIAEADVGELDRRCAVTSRPALGLLSLPSFRKGHELVDSICGGLDRLAHGNEVQDPPDGLVQARQVGEEGDEVADRSAAVDDLERAVAEDEAAHDVLDGDPESELEEIVVGDHAGLVTPVAARPSLPPSHRAALAGERLDGLDVVEDFRDVRLGRTRGCPFARGIACVRGSRRRGRADTRAGTPEG